MGALIQDLRYAIRLLAKSPGFTAVVVLTLALGIGANTAIFSVVNGVLLNPLPYPHPSQVVTVAGATKGFGESSISYPDYQDWARDNRTFASLAAYKSFQSFNLIGDGEPERVSAVEVSASFFTTLGVTPLLGRNFSTAEDQLNGPPAVILSAGLWKSKFASSPDVIGKTLNLNGTDYTVIGVLPASFYFCCETNNYLPGDVFVPLAQDTNPWMKDRRIHPGIYGVGRIREGVTLTQARDDMARIAGELAAQYPDADKDRGIAVTPLRQEMVQHIQPFILVLLAAVGIVLLIACVNVANLLLVRSARRAREFAIRAALGAGQARVVRQLLTESLLLALLGGGLGLGLASWGTSAGMSILPSTLPRAGDVRIDPRVLIFTLVVSLLAGILFGLAPALKTFQPDVQQTLKESGRGTSGAHYRTQGIFVIIEMALAVVLLVGAGLTIRTLLDLWSVNPGFDSHNVLSFNVGFPPSVTNSNATQIRASLVQITDKIAAVPGVRDVSLMNGAFPMNGESDLDFWLDGEPKPTIENNMHDAIWYIVGPGYLDAMGVPLLRGRFFTPQDNADSLAVCVIDENLARKYFGNENPIGKHLNFDLVYKQLEIVGVVGHVKQFGLDESSRSPILEQFYAPVLQLPDSMIRAFASSAGYVARTDGPPGAFTGAIRSAVTQFNGEAVVFDAETMDHIVSQSLAARRFAMILLAVFASFALILAAIGIYGVISYIVGQRTHEIGIRMALGAQRRDVFLLVLGEGARRILIGIAAGLIAALALTQLMAAVLYGVSARDPLTFASVAVFLAGVALLACYIPARRAMRVDPMVALRYE
ncbi:MAG TPA: ABC transporter permease [Candidatus Aquilonibacter sp.]|nr:ABC transporter permease [Candidatus Aquilonibacter sp.]